MNKKPTLVIWLLDGRTLFFNDVTDFKAQPDSDKGIITFKYFGIDTQTLRKAYFRSNQILGYALQVI